MITHPWLLHTAFAHRGLHLPGTARVENSLSAFRAAIKNGFGIELDVQISRDNIAVVFHDATLDRLTTTQGAVRDRRAAELCQIPLSNSPDRLMTLQDTLSQLHSPLPILVEVKATAAHANILALACAQAVRDYPGPLGIMSFDPDIIAHLPYAINITRSAINTPPIALGYVCSTGSGHELSWWERSITGQQQIVDRLQPDFIAYDINSLPNPFTRHCRRQNIPLLTWTVRTPQQKDRAAKFADNIIFEDVA